MPILSGYSDRLKIRFFIGRIPKAAHVLEIGCGSGWLGAHMRAHGWKHYTGIDVHPPADFVGDIKNWEKLGLPPEGYDVIIAFEVLEHVDCWQEMYDLLKPGGLAMITMPIPERDWVCRWLELAGLSQRRTTPHTHLIDLRHAPFFKPVFIQRVGWLAQWAILRKPVVVEGNGAA